MEIRELHPGTEHQRVVEAIDQAAGYHGIVAIHSTKLGPAVGGTRVWSYQSFDEALVDALRLSRGMTYKAALAGLPFGGGKSVIIADSRRIDRESIFRAHGRFINHFNGQYITGEDVGTTPADMELVRQETPYAAGLAHNSGDPSPFRSVTTNCDPTPDRLCISSGTNSAPPSAFGLRTVRYQYRTAGPYGSGSRWLSRCE